jgi:hypothetical protein
MATKDGRRLLFGWAGSTPPGMTVPRELLFDSALGRILQTPVAELKQLRIQPALGAFGPLLLAGTKPLFAATESAHWLDVTAVFERPSGSTSLWVDVWIPPGQEQVMGTAPAAYNATRVQLTYKPPRENVAYNATVTVLGGMCAGAGGTHPAKKPPKQVCAPPSTVLVAPGDSTIELRVLADGNVVEAFFMGGRATLLARSSPAAQEPGPVSAAVGASGTQRLRSATAFAMRDMWISAPELLAMY